MDFDGNQDVFRFVALNPLSAYDRIDVDADPGGNADDIGAGGADERSNEDAPKPGDRLSAVTDTGLPAAKLPLFRRTLARHSLGHRVNRAALDDAIAVVLRHWLHNTEEGKELRTSGRQLKWADLVRAATFRLPARFKHVPAAPLGDAARVELREMMLPMLERLEPDGRLPAALLGAFRQPVVENLVRLGFDPATHSVSRLRSLLTSPVGFTPDPGDGVLLGGGGVFHVPVFGNGKFPVMPWPPIKVPPPTAAPGPVSPLGTITQIHVGDLLVVKRNLAGYVLQEISHIENIMARELRERNHRRLRRTETTTETEIETTTESEKTHQTTERAELQHEASEALTTNEKIDVGASVSVRGGFVDASAHAGYQRDTAKTEARKVAGSFAKEVIDKAVERSRLRSRELRVVKIIEEVDESSRFMTDNRQDASHIRGVYRWLEKRLAVTLHNYGRRTIYTLLMPTPALGFAANRARLAGTVTPPARPQVVVDADGDAIRPYDPAQPLKKGERLEPLRPEHVTTTNYTHFAAFWRVSNLEAPKDWDAEWTVSKSATSQVSADHSIGHLGASVSFDKPELGVEYTAVSASAALTANPTIWKMTGGGKDEDDTINAILNGVSQLTVIVHKTEQQEVKTVALPSSFAVNMAQVLTVNSDTLELDPPARELSVSAVGTAPWGFAIALEVAATCRYQPDARLQWQHKICEEIIREYVQMLDRFEEDQRAAPAPGHPPSGAVQAIIRAELRSQVLRVMRADLAIPLDVAAFLDRAFEWDEMAWAFVAPWDASPPATGETTGDPDLDAFLQAGGARVRISVKPGYEAAIANYLGGTRIVVPPEGEIIFDATLGMVPPKELEPAEDLGEVRVPTDLVLLMNPSEVKDIYTVIKKANAALELKQVEFKAIAAPPPQAPSPLALPAAVSNGG